MARIRTIKPEFFTSEQVVGCSPTARLLFVGLWCFADDGGVHPASIRRLKMEVFPGDLISDEEVSALIEELVSAGLLSLFESQGKSYWQVTGWHHQKIDRPTYRFPRRKFDESSTSPRRALDEPSTSTRRALDEPSTTEGKGRESKGVEGKGVEGSGVERKLSERERDSLSLFLARFEEFYSEWRRKQEPDEARLAWEEAILKLASEHDDPAEYLIGRRNAYNAASERSGNDSRYVPSAAKWLREGRYGTLYETSSKERFQ